MSCYLLDGSQDYLRYIDSRPQETFKCQSCEHHFTSGNGSLCKEENVYFCHRCVLRGYHMEYFRYGNLTEYQVLNIHNSFIQI